jgi:subtilase family serine protease
VTAPGFTVAVTNTVRNAGGQPTGPFDVGIYLSSNNVWDDGDQLLATRRVTGLAAGAVSTAVTSVRLPNTLTAGSYFLIVRADIAGVPPGEVTEADETNNARATALTVVRPDLLVQSVTATSSVAATPTAVAPGVPITVRTTIKNQAVAPGVAPPTVLRLFLSGDTILDSSDAQLGNDIPVPALAGGGIVTLTRSVPIPPSTQPGPYYVMAQVNAANTVQEADSPAQGNDVKATLTPVTVGPDLVVIRATALPLATAPGSKVAVTNTVRNVGGQATGPFDVRIYLSTDAVYDEGDQWLGTRRVTDGLAPGAVSTAITSVTLPDTLTAGAFFLIVRADSASEVGEANENNNTAAVAVTVVVP